MRPSGRNASDHGCSSPRATVVTPTFVSPLGATRGASWQAPAAAAAARTGNSVRDSIADALIVGSGGSYARDDVAAGFRVEVEADQLAVAGFLEQLAECLEPVVALVEAGLAALDRLLDHRSPDLLLRIALGEQVLGGLHHELDALLPAVVPAGCGSGRRFRDLFLARDFRPGLAAHQVVVVDELVADADQEVGRGVLDAAADH